MATTKSFDNVTTEELKRIVTKDGDDRLRSELKVGQDKINAVGVDQLPRAELIRYVVMLRTAAGQTTSVKALIPQFDPMLELQTVSGPTGTPSGTDAVAPVVPAIDPNATLSLLMMQLQAQISRGDQDRRDAAAREEALVKAAAAKEEALAKVAALREEERRQDRLAAIEERRQERLAVVAKEEAAIEERRQDRLAAIAKEERLNTREAAAIEERRQAVEDARLVELNRRQELQIEKDLSRQEERDRAQLAQQHLDLLVEANKETFRRHEEERERSARLDKKSIDDARRIDVRLKNASSIMKNILFTMPSDASALPMYFENVEKLFDTNHVEPDLRVSLLAPFLTEKAREVILILPPEEVATYELWKAALLRESRLTPKVYRQKFYSAVRETDETWIQFSTRLACLLKYYLDSREVGGSYDTLVALILADRIKETLNPGTRYHISDREGAKWYRPRELAQNIDLYETERGGDNKFRAESYMTGKVNGNSNQSNSGNPNHKRTQERGKGGGDKNGASYKPKDGSWRTQIRCYNCQKLGHLSRDCPAPKAPNQASVANAANSGAFKKGSCFTCGSMDHWAQKCTKKGGSDRKFRTNQVSVVAKDTATETNTEVETYRSNKVAVLSQHSSDTMCTQTTPDVDLIISLDFGSGAVVGLVDSGSEISVLKPSMLPDFTDLDESAPIMVTLQGAFGDRVDATLRNVSAKLLNVQGPSSCRTPVLLTCAVSDKLTNDMALISLADYHALVKGASEFIPEVKLIANTSVMYCNPALTRSQDAMRLETLTVHKVDIAAVRKGDVLKSSDDKSNPPKLGADLERYNVVNGYREAQLKDPTLSTCWDKQKGEGSDFSLNVMNNLLYRNTSIGGFEIAQLVLPLVNRKKVIQVAHDSDWAMHYGVKKTTQRVEAHFYWPSLKSDIEGYVRTCVDCQKHARVTKFDRIPITPVTRAASSFEQVNIDLIGPLAPKSSRGHTYILCMVDSCTRWVEATPLRSLKAKEVCDALLVIFTRIGIPRVLICDNATNMVSNINQELYHRLGIEMRCSTPYHPEGNSLVERWNQSLKRSLHHIVNSEKPRDWDRVLPYMLWAYRELPNATTGLSPYQLVYGRLARGPLSVLKDSWSDDTEETSIVSSTAIEYLDKLKADLATGLELAEVNASKAQSAYAHQYNRRSRAKDFAVGDLVLVLMPDSTNKVAACWQGPGRITAILSPHSYRIALDTGAVKTLHANDLRKFNARVDSIGVIFDDDTEFGQIEYCPKTGSASQDEILKLDLSYLPDDKQSQLRDLLLRHHDVFNDKPGQCRVASHRIKLVEGFEPRSLRPYRIPDKLKIEVDRQIDQLLADGKIRSSNSPYAHPIVCVAKPNGEVRVCTDMRYVNSGTINDAYPMPRPEELLQDISSANFISTLDCTSGYWQIPMHAEDITKTAFVTHNGLYEWLVMPFGLKTASNTFQRVVDDILRPHSGYARAYIDDTAVYSIIWEGHLKHLDYVLTAFAEVGMTLRLSKCNFARDKVKFIGHEVGSGTRSVLKNKVEAIRAIPEPTTKKLLRSFLGMCAFYRVYIPNYSQIALPLTELTKDKQAAKIIFNETERAAFIRLKEELCNSASLYSPKSDRPFIVRTDASEFAIGACLAQVDDLGQERPIAFASAKLTDTQTRWSTIEREAYAVIFALQRFDVFLFGSEIQLFTDHDPLKYLAACVPKSAKLTRWSLSLTRYNIVVKHIHGRDNVTADCLSRC